MSERRFIVESTLDDKKTKVYEDVKDAVKLAMRRGKGTEIYTQARSGASERQVHIATVKNNSAQFGGVVLEVTWEGGEWL